MVKKGQMKIQQTAFMLIAITLLFVLVGLFVLSMTISSNKSSKLSLDEQEAMRSVARMAATPEFTCGNAFSLEFGTCVDFDKVMVLKESSDLFKSLWQVEGIEIIKIHPNSTSFCTKDNYPDCGRVQVLPNSGRGNDKSIFISLCRKEKDNSSTFDKCELAKLIVRFSQGEVQNE